MGNGYHPNLKSVPSGTGSNSDSKCYAPVFTDTSLGHM